MRTRQAGLHAKGDISIVESIVEIAVSGGCYGHGETANRIVVATDRTEQGWINENRGVEEAGYRGDFQSFVLGWRGPRDVVEIVGGNHLPNPEDNLIVEESLAIPQLVKFGAIKRFRPGQAVITLHAAGLAIGVLPVELQELHAERSAFPVQKFSGVEICPNDQRTIPAPFARLSTPGQEAVRIGQPETTKAEPGVFRQMKQTASQAGTRKLILGGRVAGDRSQRCVG